MSLKNYIFTTINTKATTNPLGPGAAVNEQPNREFRRSATGLPDEVNVLATHMNWISQAWKFVSIEPVMICWLLPSCLLYIAIENLALEKVTHFQSISLFINNHLPLSHHIFLQSCRVNFHYSKLVCDNMIDKSINNIDCVEVRNRPDNYTVLPLVFGNSSDFDVPMIQDFEYNTTIPLFELEKMVCDAEVDSQILDSYLNVYTSPFGNLNALTWICLMFICTIYTFRHCIFVYRYCVWNFNDTFCRRMERSNWQKETLHATAVDWRTGCADR